MKSQDNVGSTDTTTNNADTTGRESPLCELPCYIKWWIWLWYNDLTRICVWMGLPVVPVVSVTALLFGPGEYLRTVAMVSYLLPLGWAMIDNNYSNLRKIGLDEYRRKI